MALRYFEEDRPRALREKSRTDDVRTTESYRIGYPNVLMAFKGYVRRQDALLRLAARDLVVERGKRTGTSKEVVAAGARFQAAKGRFCELLKNAVYAD